MVWKIVRNDLKRKKVITFVVFVFITLSVTLGASAAAIIASLTQSMTELKERAIPADITQMHAGDYDQSRIDDFTRRHAGDIALQETMTLLNIDGINIRYGDNETMAGTVQDIAFAVQNSRFDFLLDLENEKLAVPDGHVAVPIYFMKEYGLDLGERLAVGPEGDRTELIISDYVRDYEMNAAMASSKRFVVSEGDFNRLLAKQSGELEYLIEFRLREGGDAQAVQTAYIEEGLPAQGPTVGAMTFLLFNALSDAAVAMVILLISALLLMISAICIRLTVQAAIDEDRREIGVMKAMGIPGRDIKAVIISKYRVLAGAAGVLGYFLSLAVTDRFTGNMRLYLASELSGSLKYGLALIAPVVVYVLIESYCRRVLKKIDGLSAVEALRSEDSDARRSWGRSFSLLKNRFLSTSTYMGIRDVGKRFRLYRLLLVIFAITTFIVILPLNVYSTMNSAEFSTCMGIGRSDLRIDLRSTDAGGNDFRMLQEELSRDPEILKWASYVTCYYPIENAEGNWDYLSIETGEFTAFPLSYLEGRAPLAEGEIALSHANASPDGLNRHLGDEVTLQVEGMEKQLTVTGIYQDVTNGGKTAKAHRSLGLNQDSVLWYILTIDVAEGVSLEETMDYYRTKYPAAQVNDLREYMQQTLGGLTDQMGQVVLGGIAVALITAVLITALFLRMLLSKDLSQIAIMRSLGVPRSSIRNQYMAGTLAVLIAGILIGVIASSYLGEFLVSLAMSSMGAARIQLIRTPLLSWVLCPMVLLTAVWITVSRCCQVTIQDDLSVVLRS